MSSYRTLMQAKADEESRMILLDGTRGGKLVITRQGDTTVALSDDNRVWVEARYPHGTIWTAEDGDSGLVLEEPAPKYPR